MKKNFFQKTISSTILAVGLTLLAAGLPVRGLSDEDPNRTLAFKRLRFDPVKDNVEGAFAELVEQCFKEVMARNPRFEWVKPPTPTDAAIQATVEKKIDQMEFTTKLVLDASGGVFSTDTISIPVTSADHEIRNAVRALMKTTLQRVPFSGTITGRDGKELTIDIGTLAGIKPGDILQISRIDRIHTHPLTKNVVDVQLASVGLAVVDQVEDSITFAHVQEEFAGEKIQRLHKVTAVEHPAAEAPPPEESAPQKQNLIVENDSDGPQLGYLSLGLPVGMFYSTSSQSAGQTNFSGSAFTPGMRLAGELWFTKRLFADAFFDGRLMSFSQSGVQRGSASTSSVEVSTSTLSYGVNAGYRHLITDDMFGPQAMVKLGYYSFRWNNIIDTPTLLSPKTYTGLNLGVGGALPLNLARVRNKIGILIGANILLLPTLKEDGSETGPNDNKSVTGVNFFLGGYLFLRSTIAVRASVLFESHAASFGRDTSTSSTAQKFVGFYPALLYYF